MKIPYGTSFAAPENQKQDAAVPAAAAMLAAPKTLSAIGRLTQEAYEKHRDAALAIELLAPDRRTFLGTVFSAGALVLGAIVPQSTKISDDPCDSIMPQPVETSPGSIPMMRWVWLIASVLAASKSAPARGE